MWNLKDSLFFSMIKIKSKLIATNPTIDNAALGKNKPRFFLEKSAYFKIKLLLIANWQPQRADKI